MPKDKYGKTALHFAAENNDVSQIEELLSGGANVNAWDEFQSTPLHYAAERDREDSSGFKMAKVLLRNGADPNALDFEARTPFRIVVQKGSVEIVQLFLDYNADVNMLDENGCNLLFSARSNKDLRVTQLLIDHGVDVNHRCSDVSSTSMHWACSYALHHNLGIIKCLLKNGADVNIADREGFTPLMEIERRRRMIMARHGHRGEREIKIFKFLMTHSDFHNLHQSGLVLMYVRDQDYMWKMIVEYLAKLKSMDISVHPTLLKIMSGALFKGHYKRCEKELVKAKSTRITNSWVTYFDLTVADIKKLKNYAGNEDFVRGFERSDFTKDFPIYGAEMYGSVKKGIERRELFDKSAVLLSNCLPILNPDHLVIRNILDCVLSKKDLSKLSGKN